MRVDRGRPEPLHIQVREFVSARIADGSFKPGERLPGEYDLATCLGVNRLTVRRAISDLTRSGLVDVRHGAGTFVADRPRPIEVEIQPDPWLAGNERLVAAYGRLGLEATFSLAGAHRSAPTGEAAAALPDGEVLVIDVVQRVNQLATMWTRYWLCTEAQPHDVTPWTEGTGAQTLTDLVGGQTYAEWRTLQAVAARGDDAEMIGVAIGAPLMQRQGLNVDKCATPVMFVDRRFRGEGLRFVMRRS